MELVQPKALTVGQLNKYIKSILESDAKLQNILVAGEISNLTLHRSGHIYLTLKDRSGVIKGVMFRGYASRLRFTPEEGMKVLAFGSVSVYEAGGQYQFYIEALQPDGIGSLSLAFEQLKEKLSKEGLFASERKKPVPGYPKRIGVATGPNTAAFQDVCNVLGRRWPVAEIVFAPTMVQGPTAAPSIVNSLLALDLEQLDVIIVCRGGGSIEDLWCFNDEQVARTVAALHTPVVSGVGHETDFTIIDFVADLRAPTPSAAAELCTPNIADEAEQLNLLHRRLIDLTNASMKLRQEQLNRLMQSNVLKSFASLCNEDRQKIDQKQDRILFMTKNILESSETRLSTVYERLQTATKIRMQQELHRLQLCAGKLDAFSPMKVLSRGYSIALKEDHQIISKTGDAHPGDKFRLKLSDGTLTCTVDGIEEVK